MKINEIFYSLQGEGFHTGRPAVFVRFSGCNLRCRFCDTRHQSGIEMSEAEILAKVAQYPAEAMVVLTGGEPSLFATASLVRALQKAGRFVAMETNGTQCNEATEAVDWITFSPKTGMEGGCGENDIKLQRFSEIKVVYVGQDLAQYNRYATPHRFLQPCTTPSQEQTALNIQATAQAVLQNPTWRLSLQTHRIIGIQ